MKKDIIFKSEDFIFSYRVAGILIYDNKILLQKPVDDDGYSLIGGHVEAMETTEETLIREFKEEMNADITTERLMAVGEVFFPWGERPCHQISLYYKICLNDFHAIPLDGIFRSYDESGNERMDLDFCWIPMDKLKDINLCPKELLPYILDDRYETIHFISKEI